MLQALALRNGCLAGGWRRGAACRALVPRAPPRGMILPLAAPTPPARLGRSRARRHWRAGGVAISYRTTLEWAAGRGQQSDLTVSRWLRRTLRVLPVVVASPAAGPAGPFGPAATCRPGQKKRSFFQATGAASSRLQSCGAAPRIGQQARSSEPIAGIQFRTHPFPTAIMLADLDRCHPSA